MRSVVLYIVVIIVCLGIGFSGGYLSCRFGIDPFGFNRIPIVAQEVIGANTRAIENDQSAINIIDRILGGSGH